MKLTPFQVYYRYTYLKSMHWRIFRLSALKSQGRICKLCGSRKRLELHHLTYERLWHEKDGDVIILCHDCHKKEHEKKDKDKEQARNDKRKNK